MIVTDVYVETRLWQPNPNPIRDALQTLPGTGDVRVTVRTDEGVCGSGEAFFGRINGGPATLAALIEQELTPLVLGTDPGRRRGWLRTACRGARHSDRHGREPLRTC